MWRWHANSQRSFSSSLSSRTLGIYSLAVILFPGFLAHLSSLLPFSLWTHCLQPCTSRDFPLGISALSQMASVLLGETEQHSGCMEGLWSQLPGSELPLPTVRRWVVHLTSLYLSLFICKIDVMDLMFGSSLNSCVEVWTFSMALFGEGAPKEVNNVKWGCKGGTLIW